MQKRTIVVAVLLLASLAGARGDDLQNHPGDVFLRLNDNAGGSRIWRFDTGSTPAFVENQGVIWSPSTRTEGLSVDKFEHIYTVQEGQISPWGPAKGPDGTPLGNNQALVIGGGSRSVVTMAGSGGYRLVTPGESYVPAPFKVGSTAYKVITRNGTSTRGRGCGSTFYPSPRVSNIFTAHGVGDTVDGPGRTDVVVGMNHWFLSDYRSKTAHGQWGNTAVRHVNAQMREEHRQIVGWIDGQDAVLFSINSGAAGQHNVGNPILTGVETKSDVDLFASCGDRCLVGADRIQGAPQSTGVPTRFMFSSDGNSPATQKMYSIRGEGDQAVVSRISRDGSGNWTYADINGGKFHVGSDQTVKTFGNAAQLRSLSDTNVDDYIYTSNVPATHFAVATRFWRNGGTYFTYKPGNGNIEWVEHYPGGQVGDESGSLHVWDWGDNPIISIAADGRGNVYYLQQALDPVNRDSGPAGIIGTPDFSSINPNNPQASRYYVSHTDDPPTVPDVGAKWHRVITVRQYPVYRLRSFNYIDTAHRSSFYNVKASGGFQERGTLSKGYFTYTITAQAPMSLPTTAPFNRAGSITNASVSASVVGTPSASGGPVSASQVTVQGTRAFTSGNTKVTTNATVNVSFTASAVVSGRGPLTVPVNAIVRFDVPVSEFNPARTIHFDVPVSGTATLGSGPDTATVNFSGTVSASQSQEGPISIGAPTGAYTFDNPLTAVPDPASAQVNDFRVDIATINVTEPPPLPSAASQIDIEFPGVREIAEDTAPEIRVENPPSFTGQFTTDAFGQANVNYHAAGHYQADNDGDGRVGYFAYSAIRSTFKWRWTVKALTAPLNMAYHDGRAAPFRATNDGVCYKGPWKAATDSGQGNPLDMAFNKTGTDYKFKDPGRYRIQLEIDAERWTVPPNLGVFSTPNDIQRSKLEGLPGNLVYYEDFDVKALPRRTKDQPVYDVAVFGPNRVTEDRTPPHSQAPYPSLPGADPKNWYAQAYVQWYGATDYSYDKEVSTAPPPAAEIPDWGHVQIGGGSSGVRMYKWDGVGKFDYRDRSAADILGAEGQASKTLHEDGHSNDGTRVDRLTDKDWALIGYTWYLKVRNPKFGQAGEPEFLPNDPAKPFGEPIHSGNLKEIYDLNNRTDAVKKDLSNGVITNMTLINPLPSNGQTAGENSRLYQITLPLMNNGAFSKFAFAVPTDPSRIRLTVRFSYPKVKWVADADPTVSYWRLTGDGSAFGKYRYGLSTAAVDQPKMGVPDVNDINLLDDYWETMIQDATPPWASGMGHRAGEMFDPARYNSARQTLYSSQTIAGLPQQDVIVTGGVIRFNSTDNTTVVTVVDNNPYQHFDKGNGSAKTEKWPKLKQFHYEVGDDPRTRDAANGGVGLKTQGKTFGFAIGRQSYSDTATSFSLKTNDFGGSDIKAVDGSRGQAPVEYTMTDPAPNDLPLPADFVYSASAKIDTWPPGNPANRIFGWGIHFVTDSDNLPLFDANASYSEISRDIAHWVIKDATSPRYDQENFRVTAWKMTDNQLPAPTFMLSGIESNNFGADPHDRAPSVNLNPSVSANASQPTTVGSYICVDRDPPNLLVEVIDFKTASPIYYVVNKDWVRDFTAPSVDMSQAFMTFKSSADKRPVYQNFQAEARDGWPTSYTKMPDTTSINLETKQGLPATASAPSLNVRMEQNVRFRVTARAVDNTSTPQQIELEIKGVEGNALYHFPEAKKDSGPITTGDRNVATLSGSHFYTSAGENDSIHVIARDAMGNSRELVVHVDVTEHETSYRIIGSQKRQVK